jgi:hypothetical protein
MTTKFVGMNRPAHYYSEVEFLSPFEVRLLASILLSRKVDSGMCGLYPITRPELRELEHSLDLSNDLVLEPILGRFRQLLTENPPSAHSHRPPCVGGLQYRFNEYAEFRHERKLEIFESIDLSDNLMMRGLGALLKANMLRHHQEFLESACMSLWIAMEASLRIIQRALRETGIETPTPKDAGEFVDSAFENEFDSDGYFADFYKDRIKTIHPESRFGVYPAAPLAADDFYDLQEMLAPLYDFLITGYVPEELKGH